MRVRWVASTRGNSILRSQTSPVYNPFRTVQPSSKVFPQTSTNDQMDGIVESLSDPFWTCASSRSNSSSRSSNSWNINGDTECAGQRFFKSSIFSSNSLIRSVFTSLWPLRYSAKIDPVSMLCMIHRQHIHISTDLFGFLTDLLEKYLTLPLGRTS